MKISTTNHDKVIKKFESVKAKAERIYNIDLSKLYITYNIRGFNTAGKAAPMTGEIRLNPNFFKCPEATKHLINVTIGHEIAHHVDWVVHRKSGHSHTWKRIMVRLGMEPERCHNVDVTKIGKTGYEYVCVCDEPHMLGVKRHNKIRLGHTTYTCNRCKETLKRPTTKTVQVPEKVAANKKAPTKKTKSPAKGSKVEQVKDLFAKNPSLSRVDMIKLIMDTCDMSKAGASTYYYNHK